MHKMFLAKRDGTDLRMIGDGLSLREFIYADDLAKIILQLLDLDVPDKIIVSGRAENSIRDVVETMKDISGFKGEIVWDPASPNGQRSRPSSKERIDKLLPDFQYTPVREGLTEAWNWFVENYPNIRTEYRL
jgi:GDP-L-fucose synthase